jgi:hypothetical protein
MSRAISTKYWFRIAVFLFAASSCSKKNLTMPISPDIDEYFSFKKGTYWIYRDSLTGQTDSLAVTDNYTQSVQEASGSYTDQTTIVVNNGAIKWNLKLNEIYFYYYESNMIADQFAISYPFPPIGNVILSVLDTCSVVGVYPTYLLNGISADTITEVSELNKQPGQNTSDDIFFLNKETGILKMNLFHPFDSTRKIWELQRYHIVH